MISSIYFERFSTLVSLFCRNTLDAQGIFFFNGRFCTSVIPLQCQLSAKLVQDRLRKKSRWRQDFKQQRKRRLLKTSLFITMFCYEICFEPIKQYRNLLFQEPMRFWLHITKDLTKLRRRRPKSNRFNDQNNNQSARTSHFFVNFFAVPAQLRLEMAKF